QSCFIPSDTSLMFTDYSHLENKQILLEVEALGSGRVSLNGHQIDNWDGTLPRALFFYLVDRGMSRRNEIFETFWPNLTVREATNVFHVTKRKISEVLGFDLTKYWSGFYHISPDIQLRYDVEIFSQHVMDSAVASDERALDLLSSAISLYKNDFLTSIPMSWAEKRREQLFSTYGEGLALLARVTESSSEKEDALGLYLRASVTNPQREDIARNVMRLYASKQMYDDAEGVYQQLVSALETNLVGVGPSKETQELIGHIRSEITMLK
ncbi:MAG: bacterial transcriptional activator domain-containing protein, partial [Candidatus Promineifilaceae bacterium]